MFSASPKAFTSSTFEHFRSRRWSIPFTKHTLQYLPRQQVQTTGTITGKLMTGLPIFSNNDGWFWAIDGNPSIWNEHSVQFRSTMDATTTFEEIKMTHLKTMVSSHAKKALKALPRVSRCIKVLWRPLRGSLGIRQQMFRPILINWVGIQVSERAYLNIWRFDLLFGVVNDIVDVFKSLRFETSIISSFLLNQAIIKLRLGLTEALKNGKCELMFFFAQLYWISIPETRKSQNGMLVSKTRSLQKMQYGD